MIGISDMKDRVIARVAAEAAIDVAGAALSSDNEHRLSAVIKGL